jgi:hypothetical protein
MPPFPHDLLGRVSCRELFDVRGRELLAAVPRKPFLVTPKSRR